MRVLITTFPSPAHFMPIVPHAWALQSAGHDVCVATPPGYDTGIASPDFHETINAAGLTAVSCGEPAPLAVHDLDDPGFAELLPTKDESERYVRELGITDDERPAWDVFYHFAMLTIRDYHPPRPRQDVTALIDFARDWKPDLVLWEHWFPCGGVAAEASGAAHARMPIAPDYTGWAHARFAGAGGRSGMYADAVRPLAERYGLEVTDDLLLGQVTLDPCMPDIQLPTGRPTIPVRFVPYTGAGTRQEWLRTPPDRPRLAITLGVSTRMSQTGDWDRTSKIFEAVSELDVDVVATLNARQLDGLGIDVPGNVRLVDYVPLDQLLPTCSAVITHGAIGTFSAAVARGVPQLICDTDEPVRLYGTAVGGGVEWEMPFQKHLTSSVTSEAVTARGAGLRIDHQTQTAGQIRDAIRRVLDDPSFRHEAGRLREDWLARPSPVAIVPELERLAAERAGGTSAGRSS